MHPLTEPYEKVTDSHDAQSSQHHSTAPRPPSLPNHRDFTSWHLGCGIRRVLTLDLFANQARPANFNGFAFTKIDRRYLVITKEDSRPFCGAQPLDLEIPWRKRKTPRELCGFMCLSALIGEVDVEQFGRGSKLEKGLMVAAGKLLTKISGLTMER